MMASEPTWKTSKLETSKDSEREKRKKGFQEKTSNAVRLLCFSFKGWQVQRNKEFDLAGLEVQGLNRKFTPLIILKNS